MSDALDSSSPRKFIPHNKASVASSVRAWPVNLLSFISAHPTAPSALPRLIHGVNTVIYYSLFANRHLHHTTCVSIIRLHLPVTQSCSPLFFSTSLSNSFSSTPVIWFSSATFHHCVSHRSLTLHLTSQTYFSKGVQPRAVYLILSILPYTNVHFAPGI